MKCEKCNTENFVSTIYYYEPFGCFCYDPRHWDCFKYCEGKYKKNLCPTCRKYFRINLDMKSDFFTLKYLVGFFVVLYIILNLFLYWK